MSFQDYLDELDKKDKLPNYRNRALIGAVVVAVLGVIFIGVGSITSSETSSFEVIEASSAHVVDENVDDTDHEQEKAQICVYVTGCVVAPQVIYLDEGSRVADAIEACGGMSPDAAASSLNLARIVQDGEQVIVQSVQEVEQALHASAAANSGASSNAGDSLSSQGDAAKVNINTADVVQLQTLNGIGASKAKKIVEYREKNGLFKSIDDLSNVSGIGTKTVDNLRDSICI